jgi:undecaprenyl diphosphate synthase
MTLPKHVAVIMDGSGRWAQRRMLPRVTGHHNGVEPARIVVRRCVELKIPVLTLFAFSSENWQRPATEVKLLMSLLQNLMVNEIQELHTNNVKLRVIGDLNRLSESLRQAIVDAQQLTINNTGLQLNIAFNYGGRWDIVQAAKAMCAKVIAGNLSLDDINEDSFGQHISLSDLPEPDLLIRTSGEQRISNFLLWQLAYTELYFSPTLWPDFNAADLDQALKFYAQRERRFGGICLDYVS